MMTKKEQQYKEVQIIKSSEIINVSAARLWSIVRKFEDVSHWFSSIDHVTTSGDPEFDGASCSNRTCYVSIKGYDKVLEKLTLFDDEKMELAYELVEGAPSFMLSAGNHWTVHEVSPHQSILKMHATMRLKKFVGSLLGGQLRRTVEKNLPLALNELKVFAETGEVAPTKKARMEKLVKKRNKKAA